MKRPEFSRRIALDTIGATPRTLQVAAEGEELAALAARFGLIALTTLTAEVTIVARAGGVAMSGRVRGTAEQIDVVTGGSVAARLDEPFGLRFVDPAHVMTAAEEVELSGDDCDTLPHDGAAVDIGEAVAQEFALALDPFPRATGSGDTGEQHATGQVWRSGPQGGALAGLADLLKK